MTFLLILIACAFLGSLAFAPTGLTEDNPVEKPKAFHAQNRVYGWTPSGKHPHPRYKIPAYHAAGNLPASVDLTPGMPEVYDQLQLGSCTANALAALFQFLLMKLGLVAFTPSRLMLYFGERAIENTKTEDVGAVGDDGMTFLQTKGICSETTWPYDPSRFAQIPPVEAWGEAYHHKIGDPVSIDNTNIDEIKSCLASGYPVVIGFIAFPELESPQVAATGQLPLPNPGEYPIGGHEVVIVGYDDATQMLKCRNSWGPGWGIRGYFMMPYQYAVNPNLASDARSARLAS